jgi:hypothetical protein
MIDIAAALHVGDDIKLALEVAWKIEDNFYRDILLFFLAKYSVAAVDAKQAVKLAERISSEGRSEIAAALAYNFQIGAFLFLALGGTHYVWSRSFGSCHVIGRCGSG